MNTSVPTSSSPDEAVDKPPTHDDIRSIGDIIRDTRALSAQQVSEILEHQRAKGLKFGEAAIALGYATSDDVLHALAQQFNYAFGSSETEKSSPELVVLNQPFGHQAEAFRSIRAQIMLRTRYGGANGGPMVKKALAVVSPNVNDGKTFFAANLAVALAQMGHRTMLVDADLRSPRQHEVFGASSSIGLAGLLGGRRGSNVVQQAPGVSNLFLLPAGPTPPNPLELLQGPAFGSLLRQLLTKFTHVVVDTAAAEYGLDGVVVAARCGASLVVARKNEARVRALQDIVQNLNAINAHVAGVVMNEF